MAELAERPADIPADVWAAADEALDNMLCNCIEASGTTEQLRIDSTEPIARAILAERERCAKIADEERAKWRGSGAKGAARNIATSIRQGSPK